jgi:hypothetical protein
MESVGMMLIASWGILDGSLMLLVVNRLSIFGLGCQQVV